MDIIIFKTVVSVCLPDIFALRNNELSNGQPCLIKSTSYDKHVRFDVSLALEL